ncbi:flagellar biosynthetic protein FliO [Desulfogranum mediterraneum]|uniref:flagellar biosynthetic protein FliO n=1 Tax=Desulfogranum mediterraneum TaxID=160661 RepID=UPI0004089EBD|nr:flagellar biosynthetic protein FliO [Desulfogranum mediterraneum]
MSPRLPLSLGLLLTPCTALAADAPSMGAMLLKTSWALLLVIGLILILYGLVKRKLLPGSLQGKAITILEVKPVMHRNSLALIEVHGRELLVAVSNNGVQLLSQWDRAATEPRKDFQQHLDEQP